MKRNQDLRIRVTEKEKEKIKKIAKQNGYSQVSEFVRRTCLMQAKKGKNR